MATFGAMGCARRVAGKPSLGLRWRFSGFWALRAGTVLHVAGIWSRIFGLRVHNFLSDSDVTPTLQTVFERRPSGVD